MRIIPRRNSIHVIDIRLKLINKSFTLYFNRVSTFWHGDAPLEIYKAIRNYYFLAPTHYYSSTTHFSLCCLSNNNNNFLSFNFIHNFPSHPFKKLFLLESDEFCENADHVSSFSKHNYDCYWHSLSSNNSFFFL